MAIRTPLAVIFLTLTTLSCTRMLETSGQDKAFHIIVQGKEDCYIDFTATGTESESADHKEVKSAVP